VLPEISNYNLNEKSYFNFKENSYKIPRLNLNDITNLNTYCEKASSERYLKSKI